MKKTETKKAMKPASKPLAKTVAKAAPAKPAVKTTAKKAAPAKKVAPAKKAVAKKAAPAKKAEVKAVAKKVVPVKKAEVKTVAKKAVVKKAAPAKKVEVKAVAKKAAPVKKAEVKAVAKKAAPAKKAEVKKPVAPVAKTVSKPAPVRPVRKKIDKNKEALASHHGRIVTKAEVAAFQNPTEGSGHIVRKSHLPQKVKAHYRELLLNLRASYQDQMSIHRDNALTNKKSGPGAGMATHMADLGSDNFQQDFELGLLSYEGSIVEMIDEALTRLDENEYGICLECGNEISPLRLELKPFARYCAACKTRKEKREKEERRYR